MKIMPSVDILCLVMPSVILCVVMLSAAVFLLPVMSKENIQNGYEL